VTTTDGEEKELLLPDFGFYQVDGTMAVRKGEAHAGVKELDWSRRVEQMMDLAHGYMDAQTDEILKTYEVGIVIGENPHARFQERRPDGSVIRSQRSAEPLRFGDVVLFRQSRAVDCLMFWKLPCSTTASCEFLLSSMDGMRWAKIPRNADVTSVSIEDVVFVMHSSAELAMN
jgi:hypothetical protein